MITAAAPTVVRDIHEILAWVFVVGAGVTGLWSLAADRWGEVRHRSLWWAITAVHILIYPQVILGVWMSGGSNHPNLGMHMFYGFVTAFSVAIIYSYRGQLADHRYLLYGLGGLFLMGLGIRAIVLH